MQRITALSSPNLKHYELVVLMPSLTNEAQTKLRDMGISVETRLNCFQKFQRSFTTLLVYTTQEQANAAAKLEFVWDIRPYKAPYLREEMLNRLKNEPIKAEVSCTFMDDKSREEYQKKFDTKPNRYNHSCVFTIPMNNPKDIEKTDALVGDDCVREISFTTKPVFF